MSLTFESPWSLDVRLLSSYSLMGTGALLAGALGLELAARLQRGLGLDPYFLIGTFVSLFFIAVLAVGGRRLRANGLPTERLPELALLVLIGATAVTAVLGLIALLVFEAPAARLATLRFGVTVGAGSGFLAGYATANSINRQIETERQRIRADAAERRQELLEYLNAILRHEVLNAAAAIDGHATLAEDRVNGDDRLRSRVEVIRRQSDELTSVIEDVRILLQAEHEGVSLEPVDLTTVLQAELRTLRDRHPSADVQADLIGEARVLADDLLPRLFSTLLHNAVEHGGPDPEVTVEMTTSSGTVTVRISDNGPGVPEETRYNLADPNTEVGEGDGLGLTIASRLAERYGGTLELAETGPEGSVFVITLERAEHPPTA